MTQRAVRASLLVLAVLGLTACEPADRRPGLWLSGEVAVNESGDWSFTNAHMEIFVETHPWYGIPFSVTTVLGTRDGKLYVPSIYETELPFPGSKYWNKVIADNPNVRLKIGDAIYEMRATLVQDPQEFRTGHAALADKYETWRRWYNDPDAAPAFVIIRMDPRPPG